MEEKSSFELFDLEGKFHRSHVTHSEEVTEHSFADKIEIVSFTNSPMVFEEKKTLVDQGKFVQDNTVVPVFQDQSEVDNSGRRPFSQNFYDEGFVTARELFESESQESSSLIEPLFFSVGIAALVGPSDTGKSSFLRQLAFDISYGKESFLGYKINAKHNRVIYVSTEDDPGSIERALKIQQGIPEEMKNTERLKFIFSSFKLLSVLDTEISNQPVDLVIVDAFADIFTGQLNANNEVRGFLNEYRGLALKYNCLIIFLHHTGKWTENKEPNKNNSIGSQGFEAKMRLVVEIRKDPRDSGIRHLCVVKGNYLREEFKSISIATRFNENMLFENLGYGVPFDQLKIDPKNQNSTSVNPARVRANQIKALDPDLSVRKITEKLAEEGFSVGKSAVGEWLKQNDELSAI